MLVADEGKVLEVFYNGETEPCVLRQDMGVLDR